MNCSPSDSSVHVILQARILEGVAISFSRGSSWPWDWAQVWIAGRFFTIWSPSESCSVESDSLWPQSTKSYIVHWILQATGVGSLSLLQGIFAPGALTQVSRIAGSFFTNWATGEAQSKEKQQQNHQRQD